MIAQNKARSEATISLCSARMRNNVKMQIEERIQHEEKFDFYRNAGGWEEYCRHRSGKTPRDEIY